MTTDTERATIADAPAILNTNDRAMWVLGWNACLDAARASKAGEATAPTEHEAFESWYRKDAAKQGVSRWDALYGWLARAKFPCRAAHPTTGDKNG